MRKTFLRTLAVTAIIQFLVTRNLAGRVIEEGRAEQLWLMYPINVFANAVAWTLLISTVSAGARLVRRAF
jgi:hypothetical protein